MTKRVAWATIALGCLALVGCSSNNSPTQPVASATPTPAPTPTPTPACTLADMPDGAPCSIETPEFVPQLLRAQDKVRAEQPQQFTSTGLVISVDDYVQAVAAELRAQGLCAKQGAPRDEVGIKESNDWNEQYDIVLGSGEVWSNYTVTCRPARF